MANQDDQKDQGQGWHDDSEEHARVGKMGGDKVAQEKGPEFYSEIGEEGGDASPTQFKEDDDRTRQAASKGGQS